MTLKEQILELVQTRKVVSSPDIHDLYYREEPVECSTDDLDTGEFEVAKALSELRVEGLIDYDADELFSSLSDEAPTRLPIVTLHGLEPTVRKAQDADLPVLMEWLKEEYDREGEGFYCNRSVIERWHNEDGQLFVVDVGGKAVALQAGWDVASVRPDLRGHGYGTLLAEYMIQQARDEDRPYIQIDCTPSTSYRFWKRFGFKRFTGKSMTGIDAYVLLPKRFELGEGEQVTYEISFHLPERDWDSTVEPYRTYKCVGTLKDGVVQLEERAIAFTPCDLDTDCVVRVTVGGNLLIEDKVKRDEAADLGMRGMHGEYGFYMDSIQLPS